MERFPVKYDIGFILRQSFVVIWWQLQGEPYLFCLQTDLSERRWADISSYLLIFLIFLSSDLEDSKSFLCAKATLEDKYEMFPLSLWN